MTILQIKEKLIANATQEEKIVYDILKRNDVYFKFQRVFGVKSDKPGKKFYVADFFFPNKNLILEIDGAYHYLPKNIDYDIERTSFFNTHKHIELLRMKNSEVIDDYNFERYLLDKLDCYYAKGKKNYFTSFKKENIEIINVSKMNGKSYSFIRIRGNFRNVDITKYEANVLLHNLDLLKKLGEGGQ